MVGRCATRRLVRLGRTVRPGAALAAVGPEIIAALRSASDVRRGALPCQPMRHRAEALATRSGRLPRSPHCLGGSGCRQHRRRISRAHSSAGARRQPRSRRWSAPLSSTGCGAIRRPSKRCVGGVACDAIGRQRTALPALSRRHALLCVDTRGVRLLNPTAHAPRSKHTNKRTNKETGGKTTKETNKQTNKPAAERTAPAQTAPPAHWQAPLQQKKRQAAEAAASASAETGAAAPAAVAGEFECGGVLVACRFGAHDDVPVALTATLNGAGDLLLPALDSDVRSRLLFLCNS